MTEDTLLPTEEEQLPAEETPSTPPVAETEEEEKEEDDTPTEEEEPSQENEAEVLSLVGQFFVEHDILPLGNNDLKTTDDLRTAIYSSVLSQVAATLPEDARQFLSYALRGMSLDEYVSTYYDANYNLATEEGQAEVLFQYYKETSSLSDEKIKRIVELARQNETLEEEAKEAVQALHALREQKLEEMEKQRSLEQKQRAEALEAAITSNVEEPLQPKVHSFFFAPIKTKDGIQTTAFAQTIQTIAQNPAHLVELAKLLLDYDEQKGFNFSRFEKKAADRAASKLAKMLTTSKERKPAEVKKPAASENDLGFFEQWLNLNT